MPNPTEIATIVVDGVKFDDWETVMVQHRWMEAFPIFEFSVSEVVVSPTNFKPLRYPRFNIGDVATVKLAGIQAIYGPITTRQSAADANQHGVQLIGKGLSWLMVKSSIAPPLGNFDGLNILQIVQAICAQTGVAVRVIGDLDLTPFQRLQSGPGEPAWDFVEQIARERNTVIGSDEFGDLLLIGQHVPPSDGDVLIEGNRNGNIKRINVVISNDTLFSSYFALGQSFGSDQSWGADVAQMAMRMSGTDSSGPSVLVIPAEQAGSPGDLAKRLAFEARIHQGTEIRCTLTVHGWLRGNGDLWRVGNIYTVIAPDHFPGFDDGIQLAAQTVTFQQSDDDGTTTTLELVLPWLLNGPLFQTDLPAAPAPSDVTPFSPLP